MKTGLLLILWIVLLTVSQVSAQASSCPNKLTQLHVGDFAQVTSSVSNRLRSNPTTSAQQLNLIAAGEVGVIVDGYACANNALWRQVNYQGIIGLLIWERSSR